MKPSRILSPFKRREALTKELAVRVKRLTDEIDQLRVENLKLRTTIQEWVSWDAGTQKRLVAAWDRADEAEKQVQSLRADLAARNAELDVAKSKLDEYSRAVTLTTYDDNTARAALMQLRVMQMNVRGRTGYGVTVFIPNEVLEKLRTADGATKLMFRDAVFTASLERALNGMWHINSRGNISAILFAPKGAPKEGIAGAVFDADTNPQVEFARSKAADPVIRRIEQTIIESQPENSKPVPALPRESTSEL